MRVPSAGCLKRLTYHPDVISGEKTFASGGSIRLGIETNPHSSFLRRGNAKVLFFFDGLAPRHA